MTHIRISSDSVPELDNQSSLPRKQNGIYVLRIEGFGEAVPAYEPDEYREGGGSVEGFEWSADGRFIVFTSRDEYGRNEWRGEDEPIIYGDDEETDKNTRLKALDIERRSVETLTPPERNVSRFSLNPSPSPNSGIEAAYTTTSADTSRTTINIVSTLTSSIRHFNTVKSPITSLIWTAPTKMHFISHSTPPYTTPSVYEAHLKTKQYGSYFAWDGEAISLTCAGDSVIAKVRSSDSRYESFHALGFPRSSWPFKPLFKSEFEITAFDAYQDRRKDGFTLVFARSTPQSAPEIWSFTTNPRGSTGLIQLSSHNSSLDEPRSERISTRTADGDVDGWLFSPRPSTTAISRGLPPTIVLNPETPSLPSYTLGTHLDVAVLTSAGYAVLTPTFTQASTLGERYAVLLTLLQHASATNLIDKTRVGISGWGEGSFLASLAALCREFPFRAARPPVRRQAVLGQEMPDNLFRLFQEIRAHLQQSIKALDVATLQRLTQKVKVANSQIQKHHVEYPVPAFT